MSKRRNRTSDGTRPVLCSADLTLLEYLADLLEWIAARIRSLCAERRR